MTTEKAFNKKLETMAWGLIFIWWGFSELAAFLPKGGGWVGFGLILLGLNVARSLKGVQVNGFSISLGLFAFFAGSRELARTAASQSFVLFALAMVLLGCGALMLAPEIRRN